VAHAGWALPLPRSSQGASTTATTVSGKFIAEEQEIASSVESHDEAKAKCFWQLASEVTDCSDAALPE
jgi:hypothetical protein